MIDQDFVRTILRELNYITKEDEDAALAFEDAGKGSFLDYLLNAEIINKSTLGLAIAEHYKIPFADMDTRSVSAADLKRIPEELARSMRAVLYKEDAQSVTVATDVPDAADFAKKLAPQFPGKNVVVAYAFTDGIDNALSHYQKELNTRFTEIIKNDKRVAPELFDAILNDALTYRASDIHFEPQESGTVIRFRIDGILHLAGTVPKEQYESVLNRIKIQANLRIDEHLAPQDGAIRIQASQGTVDLRVSIVPAINGEKTVIRVLAEYVRGLNFSDLGFSQKHIDLIERAVAKPFGMILVSGPTGSGKTTTLYSLIRKLNTPEVNITTIEDPVEYRIVGANQIQVNAKADLTFAKGLRSVVRQDPNIILVGEIRDTETAEVAVNAALTGHLLLSTFHANDAATSIPRLLDMAVEPFLLSSTLELLIAQRLVRRICNVCRESYDVKRADLEKAYPLIKGIFNEAAVTLYRGKGCAACNDTGYQGRSSVIEMIDVTPTIKELIGKNPSAQDIASAARAEGSTTLFDDALEKAKTGVTTLEEVLRVTTPSA